MQLATPTSPGPARGALPGGGDAVVRESPTLEGRGAEMAAGVESSRRCGRLLPAAPSRGGVEARSLFFSQAPLPSAKEDRISCCGPTDTDRPEARGFRGRG